METEVREYQFFYLALLFAFKGENIENKKKGKLESNSKSQVYNTIIAQINISSSEIVSVLATIKF